MIPEGPADNSDAITSDTKLKDILMKMAALAVQAKEAKAIDTITISALDGRQFWVYPRATHLAAPTLSYDGSPPW